MKIARLLCAICVCATLTTEAGAAESPAQNGSLPAAAHLGQAAGGTALGRDTIIKAGRAKPHATQADTGKGGGSKGRSAAPAVPPRCGSAALQCGVGQLAGSNADRLHALLSKQAQGRIAKGSNRPFESNRAVTGNGAGRGPGPRGASPAGLLTLPHTPPANSAARVRPSPQAVTGGSMIGGPRAAGPGGLGGPAFGRTANNAIIDGKQRRRKF